MDVREYPTRPGASRQYARTVRSAIQATSAFYHSSRDLACMGAEESAPQRVRDDAIHAFASGVLHH